MVTLILSSVVVVTMALLQPAKGAVIALQWWLGMHGFERPLSKAEPPFSSTSRAFILGA